MKRRYAFIAAKKEEDHHAKVSRLCSVVGVSHGTWYRQQSGSKKRTQRQEETDTLVGKIRDIWMSNGQTYGSPSIHGALRNTGVRCSRKRVERLMRINGIFSHVHTHRSRTTIGGDAPSTPDLVERRFTADAPNKVWWTDITYIWTKQGWLYLAAIEDGYSRKVVGYAFADHLKTSLPLKALHRALKARMPQEGLIHHSDRGCQYTSWTYQHELRSRGIRPSMGRTGVCWDNAPAESFWATLKKEVIHRQQWKTRRQVERAVTTYIARFNKERVHSALNYLSPEEFELQNAA